ncbi:sensor domain-containing diguanylate cyclase [Paucisalibacillus sp. EB02]|uniref:sensor domain-containing diguanylate cyclase n=1 Tax=Paucisalibacillus sp. EB02 TaxID=1347087 RepID=UPI0004B49289|nr:sensor domain-containing diguanylate cyclase [Paucisalibacillus sp. EB02]
MSRQKFQENLILLNYEMLTKLSPKSKEYFYEMLSENVKTVFDFAFSGIYLYDKWTNCYKLVSSSKEPYILMDYIQDHNSRPASINSTVTIPIEKNIIFHEMQQDIDLVTIPFYPKDGPFGMVVCGYDPKQKSIADEIYLVIKEEIEKLLTITYPLFLSAASEQKHQLLYEMTTKFLVLTNKTDILIEIISSIRSIYPDFGVNLLLAQDHDDTLDLPIRTIKLSDQSISSQAFLNGEVLIENRIKEKDTCIYAPLKGHQGVYGVLQIIAPTIFGVQDEDILFITKFSNTAGLAIESTTLYQNSNHLVSDLRLINDLTHKLNSHLDLIEITKLVRNQISQICHPEEIGFIYNMQENNIHHYDVVDGSTDFFETLPGHGFIRDSVNEVLKRKEAIFAGDYKSTGGKGPYRSVMVLPMENAGSINGFVVVLHREAYAFTFDHFKLLQSIIHHSTLAFVNTILAEKLKKAASTDYLTQLYSRNYLDEKIMQHMEKGAMGTLILFDIDDFKQVNDKFGHYVGDEVIKQVADIIMQNIEEQDIAARWGGEELAIYLPSTDLNSGVQLARIINTEVENFTEPNVTLSAGVSTWTSEVDDTARNFFIRADKALYEAKSYGKNCVVKYSINEQVTEN